MAESKTFMLWCMPALQFASLHSKGSSCPLIFLLLQFVQVPKNIHPALAYNVGQQIHSFQPLSPRSSLLQPSNPSFIADPNPDPFLILVNTIVSIDYWQPIISLKNCGFSIIHKPCKPWSLYNSYEHYNLCRLAAHSKPQALNAILFCGFWILHEPYKP